MDRIKGKTTYKKKLVKKDEGVTYKTKEKLTKPGEKVTIQTVKYKKGANPRGVKKITTVTGNTKNMGYLSGNISGTKQNNLTKVYVKKYKN